VDVGAKRIAIFNIEGTYHAIDDKCTHRGGPLSEGIIVGTEVTCPWHGAVFNAREGYQSRQHSRRASRSTHIGALPRPLEDLTRRALYARIDTRTFAPSGEPTRSRGST
jgi:nitrite reductase/ring-hydroxylating ferredoxin subunit